MYEEFTNISGKFRPTSLINWVGYVLTRAFLVSSRHGNNTEDTSPPFIPGDTEFGNDVTLEVPHIPSRISDDVLQPKEHWQNTATNSTPAKNTRLNQKHHQIEIGDERKCDIKCNCKSLERNFRQVKQRQVIREKVIVKHMVMVTAAILLGIAAFLIIYFYDYIRVYFESQEIMAVVSEIYTNDSNFVFSSNGTLIIFERVHKNGWIHYSYGREQILKMYPSPLLT